MTVGIITLNVNGVKTPIERQRLAEWLKQKDSTYVVYKKPILNI